MNIHINDKMLYYLPICFKMENVPIDEQKKLFIHMKTIKRMEIINHWEEELGSEFNLSVGIAAALYYAIAGDDGNCSRVLRVVQAKKGHLIVAQIIRCILMCEQNKFDEALSILKVFPIELAKLPFISRLKADIYFDMKDYARAEKLYLEVTGGKLTYESSVYSRLGEIYMLNNRHEEAKEHYLKAIEMDEKNIMAHFYLGDIYKVLGEPGKAMQEYGICASIDFGSTISKMAQQKLFLLTCESGAKPEGTPSPQS